MLFGFIASLVGNLIDSAAGVPITSLLIWLVLLLPNLTVFVRRMHDIDRAGWWAPFPIIPILTGIIDICILSFLPYAVGGERPAGVGASL